MKLLDTFCGAGGCSRGYHDAGFDVTGVDKEPHPDYPYELVVADALDVLADRAFLEQFDVIHASPPCQGYTTMSNRYRGKGGPTDDLPRLIATVRGFLVAWSHTTPGGVYIIENVTGARPHMVNPLTLHGGMFGLRVHRPRLFETNGFVMSYDAPPPANPVGVYGKHHDGRRLWTRTDGTNQYAAATLEEAQQAMGIDWMRWHDLTEAIPPAYTKFIGEQLLDVMYRAEVSA